ncbi:hypothetical protein B0W47_07385 [Komagataeibacter nataicola]|uniref:Lipoprotein n=1 Tax=Komagataeibacter nataicola TaxID=265960 RepID=A0A9N7CR49_9PROT|nr:hypothetical protein [Komagataeibacter nataicola]AQU87321.1 hypothetical protein B0W47_07385 [Komagataeibacter nataicola]PYD67416.1 hypothetical protein CDI09_02460 [Komagataeibacter nataicola]WEQ55728.1 hypothetical protein LV564_16995 [Komagataeibacter nataicola]WNM09347.1 hypothetical protein RI056_05080 [Komagataeibacter nataicola]GBR15087.1 hypothetical protein AA0616_0473 [Komagataeibacter nataicola NRIC 0616]
MLPRIRILLACLCLGTVGAAGAQARSHHFNVREHHPHGRSPYGDISGFVPTVSQKDPRYVSASQRCQSKAGVGAMGGGNSGSAQTWVGSSHTTFFSECMVEAGVWQPRYDSNVGDSVDP